MLDFNAAIGSSAQAETLELKCAKISGDERSPLHTLVDRLVGGRKATLEALEGKSGPVQPLTDSSEFPRARDWTHHAFRQTLS